MIEITDLTYAYTPGSPIFQGFSWQAQRGETWAILGPSGCGKSTLLSLLAGLIFPLEGQVRIDGQQVERPRPQTGLIIQDYGLLPWATLRENARLGLRVRNFYGPDGVHAPRAYTRTLDVDYWLERLGLLPYAEKYPQQVSGGQRQRTAIARTLSIQPDLLLMDEPFSSLDAPTREGLQDLMCDLSRETGVSLVIVTHAIEEAAVMGQKILLLEPAPNRAPQIIDNPAAGQNGYRESQAYYQLCRDLRARLEPAP
jgi:NitT/TauT family transport system ATP-binding protein